MRSKVLGFLRCAAKYSALIAIALPLSQGFALDGVTLALDHE